MTKALSSLKSISPALLKVLKKRGFEDAAAIQAYLYPDLAALYDPLLMKGMREAVEKIRSVFSKHEKVLIHGDYDVDGITGAAIVAHTLAKLGIEHRTFLPERERDGYGVSARAIKEAAAEGFKLLVTVDCGVSAATQVQIARDLEMSVIVIDHHRIPSSGLPNADVILNPLQSDCPYPFKDLSAAGLAFKLAYALLGEAAFEFLDLAALSTISDVAPLCSENRVIVKRGLEVIASQKRAGIAALLAVSKVKTSKVTTTHVAFNLAPRINAAGRMSSPDSALRLLVTNSLKEASSLAQILDSENETRKQIERRCTQEAIETVTRTFNFNRDRVMVVSSENWHIGVIGIVAARLVDKFQRPAIVIAFQDGVGKGSGRSIVGFHLFHALQYCAENLKEFGGHAQAAGLSVKPENIDAFRARINEYATENLDASCLKPRVEHDLELGLADLTETFAAEIQMMEPHGAGNAYPRFLTRGLKIVSSPKKNPIGSYDAAVSNGQQTLMMQFREEDYMNLVGLPKEAVFDAVYEIRRKSWNGIESISLIAKQIDTESASH